MINIENITPDTSKELLTVLSFCEQEILNNIPNPTITKLNELAAYSKKDFFINKNVLLKDQELSEETKLILTNFYYEYISNNDINDMLEEEN